MNILQKVYYTFSRYTDPAERRIGKFFARVNERDSPRRLELSLVRLLQHNIAVVNLWTEHRYKGYDYLSKRMRRQLYQNLAAIEQDFAHFEQSQQVDTARLLEQAARTGASTTQLRVQAEKLAYMGAIMQYLSTSRGLYEYRASSSFGRLLRDPRSEVLVGDCNQIVTLYIALYSARYDVSDLQLTLYPGHVAIHFYGVDVETTRGTFARYDKPGQVTAPIHEIVSVNLLDTTDTNFTKSAINPEVFLESARLAYVVSSNRAFVKKNLEIAYHNAVRHMMSQKNYRSALSYAQQSKNHELIESVARAGASHGASQHDFAGARRFAAASQNKAALLPTIDRQEASWLYSNKQYREAIKLFERLHDKTWVGHSYRGLYVQQQAKLGPMKTVADVKANASIIRTMERYAKRSGDKQLVQHAANLTKHL